MWEILQSTIRKMIKHVMKLQREVDEAHDRREAAQRKVRLMEIVYPEYVGVMYVQLSWFLVLPSVDGKTR